MMVTICDTLSIVLCNHSHYTHIAMYIHSYMHCNILSSFNAVPWAATVSHHWCFCNSSTMRRARQTVVYHKALHAFTQQWTFTTQVDTVTTVVVNAVTAMLPKPGCSVCLSPRYPVPCCMMDEAFRNLKSSKGCISVLLHNRTNGRRWLIVSQIEWLNC